MPEETPNAAHTTGTHFTSGVAETAEGSTRDQGPDFDPYNEAGGEESSEQKLLTREEHERSLKRRLARQERKLREELQAAAQEEARKSRMDEVDRLKVEREEAVQASKAAIAQAHEQIMLAEAKAQAASMGVSSESLKYISRLVDLSEVDVVDGRPDEESIRDAVSEVLKDVPALAQAREVAPEDAENNGANTNSPIMPMGRDRSPDASRSTSKSTNNPLEMFNRRMRQQVSGG